jgi:hypothetical protein
MQHYSVELGQGPAPDHHMTSASRRRALLNISAAPVAVIRRSPFAPKQSTPSTPQTPKAAADAQHQQSEATEQHLEFVVPIMLQKVSVRHIPDTE